MSLRFPAPVARQIYEPFPLSVGFRARAVALLEFLAADGLTDAHIPDLEVEVPALRLQR